MKKILSIFFLTLCVSLFAQDKKDIEKDIIKYGGAGIRAVYNLDFPTAQKNIDIAFQKYPNHPYAHFGNMLIAWGRFTYEFEKSDPEQKKIFESVLSSSINGINIWLKDNPKDPTAFMALGGAYGLKGMFAMDNKNWVTAYFSAKKGISYMRKALEADPEFYDAYFGLGIYEYYTGTLPSVIKVLAKIVAIKGNQTKGIEYLNISKEKGQFTSDSSKLMLVEIYNNRLSQFYNPQESLMYIRTVSNKYPANPLMPFVEIITEFENKNYDIVIKKAKTFINKIGAAPFYTTMYIPRSYTAIGTAQMAKGEWEQALKTFENAKAISFNKSEPTRWAVWNLIRLGQCYDALGQREKALSTYRMVTAMPNTWELNDEAKKFIKTPFTKETALGPLPPL
ncbi:hypothetical protein Emin_1504 [Elusimicrobium minutum Pei191]|uniref:Tetratricopeptide repeat protein n=1 Tax=Elusimicrobium minutum (strain Pei191) TaxID=445932 RepID=B2KEV6_ELUMP|nr:tetratricopeptide repeat protein [Elusimicrobium minutum]ACC99052.1 hypothetical protein Emin_1504 [Elusimicrobium minutum Pei191]